MSLSHLIYRSISVSLIAISFWASNTRADDFDIDHLRKIRDQVRANEYSIDRIHDENSDLYLDMARFKLRSVQQPSAVGIDGRTYETKNSYDQLTAIDINEKIKNLRLQARNEESLKLAIETDKLIAILRNHSNIVLDSEQQLRNQLVDISAAIISLKSDILYAREDFLRFPMRVSKSSSVVGLDGFTYLTNTQYYREATVELMAMVHKDIIRRKQRSLERLTEAFKKTQADLVRLCSNEASHECSSRPNVTFFVENQTEAMELLSKISADPRFAGTDCNVIVGCKTGTDEQQAQPITLQPLKKEVENIKDSVDLYKPTPVRPGLPD